MIALSLSEIAAVVEGQLINNNGCNITQISTDTRSLVAGDLFLALKGPNFDGHKFAEQAVASGCAALIVAQPLNLSVPQIIVKDTRIALGQLGAYVKAQANVKTVGITGSSGKTTVKEMVAAILRRLGKVLATEGNFNNDIGVPLTLLRLTPEYDYAVIEMGANHIGEIAYTCELVKPDVAVINNVAAAHLEGFGDLAGVARAKGEIFSGLVKNGVAIYNQDNKFTDKWQFRLADKRVRTISCFNQADCYATDVILDENGCASFKLNSHQGSGLIQLSIPGRHNVCNAVAAAAVALEFGASLDDIRLGLHDMQPVKGRLNLYQLNDNIKLIDDTYNANVESIKAAITLLANYPGRTILVLGDMAELGSNARAYHQEIGEYAKQQGIGELFTLGVLSQSSADGFGQGGEHYTSRSNLVAQLLAKLANEQQQVTLLVKGSRSAHMELVVEAIQQHYANNNNKGQN